MVARDRKRGDTRRAIDRGGDNDAHPNRGFRRDARHGAARRRGRRPRGVVGEGILPPGGRGAQGDHRRLRAGDRQAGRAHPSSRRQSFRPRSRRRSRPASRPTSPSASGSTYYIRKVGLRRPAGRSHRRRRPLLRPVRSRSARLRPCCSTPGPGSAPCTACRWADHATTSTSGRACWSTRASPSTTFPRSGMRSGRSGATRFSQRYVKHGPRRHLGRRLGHSAPAHSI